MNKNDIPPHLEQRFQEPEGWRWHGFERNGRRIRFGSVFPQDSIPDAVVVCLPGLSEFSEKYFEVARDLNEKNLAFWVIDWMGQGASGRYLPNPFKRHSTGYQNDIDDLHYFIIEYIKHSSVHPDKGRIPLAMLGHSMGAHIGLRFLAQHPGLFECAAFSAPMAGIYQMRNIPSALALMAAEIAKSARPQSYAFGQEDWSDNIRATPGYDALSSDEKRGAVHGLWWNQFENLRVGGVTYRWVYESLRSCKNLAREAKSVQTPIIIALAGDDEIVDNRATTQIAKQMPACETFTIPNSKHEILMETDVIRDEFLGRFYKIIEETIISKPETIKKF